jgi:hypothetical protein
MESIVPLGLTSLVYLFSNARTSNNNVEFDILQYRDPNSYTQDTLDYIRLVTTKPDVNPVGSQKFKVHKYPGDIDIFEKIQECCNLDIATKKISEKIQKIAKNIKNTPNTFLGDFKAGIDQRFFIDIGKVADNTVVDYNPNKIRNLLKFIHSKKYLTDSEFEELMELVVDKPDLSEFEQLFDKLRSYYIVRWSLDDLIKGYKIIRNKKIYLKKALTDPTIVKIDLWAAPQGRFTEITNFFVLSYLDEDGKQHPINIELEDRIQSLLKDIYKYSSPTSRKSLKYAKRLWVLTQIKNNKDYLEKLFPLFSSSAGILNQISSEIETLTFMFQKLKKLPINIMMNQIDGFKARINSIYDIDIDENRIYSIVDNIVNHIKNNKSDLDRDFIIKSLSEIDEVFSEKVEEFTNNYLDKNGLNDTTKILKKLLK